MGNNVFLAAELDRQKKVSIHGTWDSSAGRNVIKQPRTVHLSLNKYRDVIVSR